MRIIFFGTPEFAVPSLEAVRREHEVVAVVTQPDRPSGRGMQMQAPAAATEAKHRGLRLLQPEKIRAPEFLDAMSELTPDAGIVIAYGKILPAALLEIPRHGFFNVHASLLPRYRGAAPIQRAIAAGETTTGVTIMRVDEQLDHGPILATASLEIGQDERAPSVARRLSLLGAETLLGALRAVANGAAQETPQDDTQATFAPKIEKREGRIDWSDFARAIYDRFRAFDPWPGAFFDTQAGETIHVTDMRVTDGDGQAGTILEAKPDGVVVATGSGALHLIALKRPGKRAASATDVARALAWSAGTRLA